MKSNEQVALVTGASSGLGEAIARRLAESGWTVGLVARRAERLEALAAQLSRAHVFAGDLQDPAFSESVVSRLLERTQRLDLLVNNAGAPVGSAAEIATDDEVDRVFALNVRAAYRLSVTALPALEKSKGSIIHIGSAGVARNIPLDLVYLTSKGALETMSRGMAKKWAPRGVRVNTVSPGLMETEIFQAAGLSAEAAREHLVEARAQLQPLPRKGHPDDVAHAVAFLASESAAFITGATLHVDGGMSLGG